MSADDEPLLDAGRLYLLREIALRGSIAAASRSLGLTPSAISQQMTVLERETNTALLHRSSRGVTLTGAGEALVARAGELVEVLAAARADLERIAGTNTGLVSLACVSSAAVSFVSDVAQKLAAGGTGIDISVVTAEPTTAFSLLQAGDADLAIVDEYDYVPLAMPDFVVTREILREPLVLVSRPGAVRGRRPRLVDLSEARWVMPPTDAACGIAVRSACRAEGFEPKVYWETDDLLLLVRAVGAGHGVAVLPRLSVVADTADVEIKLLSEPVLERRLTAVARSSVLSRPVVATVLDALESAAHAYRVDARPAPHTGVTTRGGVTPEQAREVRHG